MGDRQDVRRDPLGGPGLRERGRRDFTDEVRPSVFITATVLLGVRGSTGSRAPGRCTGRTSACPDPRTKSRSELVMRSLYLSSRLPRSWLGHRAFVHA